MILRFIDGPLKDAEVEWPEEVRAPLAIYRGGQPWYRAASFSSSWDGKAARRWTEYRLCPEAQSFIQYGKESTFGAKPADRVSSLEWSGDEVTSYEVERFIESTKRERGGA